MDEYSNSVILIHAVALAVLGVKADVVAKTGTPAALHAQTQSAALGRDVLLGHGATDLLQGLGSYLDALLRTCGIGDRKNGGRIGFFRHCHCHSLGGRASVVET